MPVQVSVRVEGVDRIRAGLSRWARTIVPVTREAIQAMLKRALKRSIPYQGGTTYSVRETGGGYQRTGNLGRSSYVEQDGLSTRVRVEAYRDGRSYGEFVVGKADGYGQAGVHMGRWVPLRQAVDAELEKVTGELDRELQSEANKAGL